MIEISGAISGLSATLSGLKTAVAARDEVKINDAISSLKDRLFEVQTANLHVVEQLHAAQARVQTLVKETEQLQTQLDERSLYVLYNLAQGVGGHFWTYRYQPGRESLQPATSDAHYLCQPCFDAGKKVILVTRDGDYWDCPGCGKGHRVRASKPYTPRSGGGHMAA